MIKDKVIKILSEQAPEIPKGLISSFVWHEAEVPIGEIEVDSKMWNSHGKEIQHQKRLVSIEKAVSEGATLPPIILMHNNNWLVDGYTRVRCYLKRNISTVKAWIGNHPNKRTTFRRNGKILRDFETGC